MLDYYSTHPVSSRDGRIAQHHIVELSVLLNILSRQYTTSECYYNKHNNLEANHCSCCRVGLHVIVNITMLA